MRKLLGISLLVLAGTAQAQEGIFERITSPSSAFVDQFGNFTRVGIEGDFFGDSNEEGLFIGTRSFSGLSGSETMFGGRITRPISSFEDVSNMFPLYEKVDYSIVAEAGYITGEFTATYYEAKTSGLFGSIMLETAYSLSDSFALRIGTGFGIDNYSVEESFDILGYTGTQASDESTTGFIFSWGLSSQF